MFEYTDNAFETNIFSIPFTCQYYVYPIHVDGGRQSGLHGRRRVGAHGPPVAHYPDDVQFSRGRIGPEYRAARIHLTRIIGFAGVVRAQLFAGAGASRRGRHSEIRPLEWTRHGTLEVHGAPACLRHGERRRIRRKSCNKSECLPRTLTVSPTKSLLTYLNGRHAGPTLAENGISSYVSTTAKSYATDDGSYDG